MTTIRQCADDSLVLVAFAQAGKARLRRQADSALKLYESIIRQRRNQDMSDLACIKAAELCFAERRFAECRAYGERLHTLSAESIYADRSVILTARAWRAEGKKTEARGVYEELLRSFPRSIFAQEARTTLRLREMQP